METQHHHLRLLSATAQGDRQAFASLYQATSGRLLAVGMQMLQSRDLAEDALQEAFVKIWHNAGEYRDERGTVLTWMTSIIRYRALDMLRSKKSRREDEFSDGESEAQEDERAGPDYTFYLDRDRAKIDDCMDHLDKPQADAIQLAYFRGFTHQEVCGHLDSPLGSVKSWIRRGLQLLKRCIEK